MSDNGDVNARDGQNDNIPVPFGLKGFKVVPCFVLRILDSAPEFFYDGIVARAFKEDASESIPDSDITIVQELVLTNGTLFYVLGSVVNGSVADEKATAYLKKKIAEGLPPFQRALLSL